MTDSEVIARICAGWLQNKYSYCPNPKDTARVAYEIAKEILRLMKEGGERS